MKYQFFAPISWHVYSDDSYYVTIDRTNEETYAIRESGSYCWSKSLQSFIYEPSPSNRDKDFVNDTRFNSLEEVIKEGLVVKEIFEKKHLGFLKRCCDKPSAPPVPQPAPKNVRISEGSQEIIHEG